MKRRSFLTHGFALSAGVLATGGPRPTRVALAQSQAKWRTFEVITRIEPTAPSGVTRAWIPVPLMGETDYFRRLGDTWKGNAAIMRLERDPKYAAGYVYAEWPGTDKAPVIEITMNWLAYNYAHSLKLPNSQGKPVAFLMYPQAETANERKDSLDPATFRYTISSKELSA